MEYTIAMGHQKISRRFKHNWSETYFKCLQETKGFTFNCTQEPEGAPGDQHKSDHDFMTVIASICKDHPDWALPRLIPKLIAMSSALPIRGSPLSIYTSETYMEFHSFLCLLLRQFRSLLEDLQNLKKPQPGWPDIRQLVGKIFALGYALWKMASSYAFEVHMRNIEHLLIDPRSLSSRSSSNLASVSDEEVEWDEEIEASLPSIVDDPPTPLRKAYRSWVLQLVIPFKAASILQQFIRSPNFDRKPISFEIVTGERVGSEFIPLDEYFKSEYFPGDAATKELIANFVAEALSLKKQYKYAVQALETWDKILAANLRETRRQFYDKIINLLTDAVNADPQQRHSSFLQDIKTSLHEWTMQNNNVKHLVRSTTSTYQDHREKYLNKDELADEIGQKLRGMVEFLREELVQYGAVADIQAKFRGALHCEASLASLLDPQVRQNMAGNSDLKAVLDSTMVGCF